jgi:FkbM family methyltransferase
MMLLLANLLRILCFPLITQKGGYFAGMLLVRLGRKLRKMHFNKKGIQSEKQKITVFRRAKMEVEPSSYIGGTLFWFGMHHVNEIIALNSILKPNFTFVDVGANQGEFTIFAATKLKSGRVISFEPVSKQFSMLQKNIELNNFSNIELNNYGLSETEEKLPIYTSTDTELHSGIHEGLSTLFRSNSRTEIEEIVSLKIFDDEYFTKLVRFDFLKIDIEGAELFALKGMHKSLLKFKPMILIEINDETFTQAGYSSIEVLQYLAKFGYQPYKIFRGKLIKVTSNKLEEWGNYIFKV